MTTPSSETEFVSILDEGGKSELNPRVSARSLPDILPILGLSDIVIFPGAVVPLLVETGPSLKLIDDIVAGDRLFGAVLQRKNEVAEPAPEDLYTVGCVSRLTKMVKFPDGTARVLVEGLWRIQVKEFEPPSPYLRAHYELMRDKTEDTVELQAMLRNAHKQFEEIAKMSTALTEQVNDPAEPHAAVCRDPRDDYLVALARSSGAEAVVTGDLDLLAIDTNELEIEVLTPRLLVERLAAS